MTDPYRQPGTPPQRPNSGYQIPPPTPPQPGINPPPPRRNSTGKVLGVVIGLFILLGGGALFLLIIAAAVVGANPPRPGGIETVVRAGSGEGKVVIIQVHGVILSGDTMFSAAANSNTLIEKLRRAGKDSRVKAVVLDINSPGGEITATDEVYNEIQKLRKQNIKVVTCMRSVAASGGYYLAAGTDYIFANRLTMTGSIGVIMGGVNYSSLLNKIGVSPNTYKSGEMKDMGSPARRPLHVLAKHRLELEKRRQVLQKSVTADGKLKALQRAEIALIADEMKRIDEEESLVKRERQLIQKMVGESFREFANVVATGRNLPIDKVMAAPIGDARVVSGAEALKLKLIDKLGYLEDAIDHALAGKDYRVVRYDPPESFISSLTGRGKKVDMLEQLIPFEYKALKKGRLYYLNPNLF